MNKYQFIASSQGYQEAFTVYANSRAEAFRIARMHHRNVGQLELVSWY